MQNDTISIGSVEISGYNNGYNEFSKNTNDIKLVKNLKNCKDKKIGKNILRV